MNKVKAAADVFNQYALEYQERFMDVSLYHHSLDLFCKHLSQANASVLELACGPGNITKYLLSQLPTLQISASDLAPNMVELAKQNNPSAQCYVMDCRALNTIHQNFDALMCGFCLPYLSPSEAQQLIQDGSILLNKNGIIYLSTMIEDEQHQSGIQTNSKGDEVMMYFHQADYLKSALKQHGFILLDEIYQDFPNSEQKTNTDLILIAKKSS